MTATIISLIFLLSSGYAISCDLTTHGADALNPTGYPIGGGVGYTNMINPADATYTVSTKNGLLSALSSATSGDIIYVDDDAEIDLTPVDSTTPMTGIVIPAGVTLGSGRGRGGSLGAYIYTTYTGGSGAYKLFVSGGDGTRITGLRIDGKDYSTSRLGSDPLTYGIHSRYNTEVDNNEIYGFRHSAVNIKSTVAGSYSYIHHNYIHHNIRTGFGYGVAIDTPYYENANVIIEANLFDWNRHSIAASGGPTMSYTARYNIQLEHGTSHTFDVHGDGPKSSHVGGNAGNTTLIYGNTFYSIFVSSDTTPTGSYQAGISIRGVPANKAEVYDNYFYYDTEPSAITQYDLDGNVLEDFNYISMSVYNNCYGGFELISLCDDGIQNLVETGIDCGGPCISCQEYNDPPVISDISSSSIISTAAIITWTTNKKSDTQVEYGPTTDYGYSNNLDTTKLVTSHSQVLFDLSNSTTYHYRVKSKDNNGYITTSADRTFITSGGQETGAIASWKFDETRGMTVTDSSGNGNDGTINGATWTTGKIGSALSFDGVTNYVNIGNPASLQITGAISMEGWVKLNDLSENSALFGKGHGMGSAKNYGYFLTYYASRNQLVFDTYSPTTRDALSVRYAINDKNWHHIAVTWDGTTSTNGKKLYIDRALLAQKTSSISSMGNPSYDFRIGIDSSSYSPRPADAIIDEVKVYNRAISASEVFAEYYTGLDSTPPELSSGNPSGTLITGTTQTTITLSTDESSTCKYSTTPNMAYNSIPNTFTTTGSTSHSTLVTGLMDGQTYNYYVRCQDTALNANTDDFLISFSIKSASSQNAIIAHWKFDETTGIIASDISGNNNAGTINGASWTQGINDNALSFDGVNDYISIPQKTYELNSGTTFEFWLKLNDTTKNSFIMGDTSTSYYKYIYFSPSGSPDKIFIETNTNGDVCYGYLKNPIVADTNWHHFTLVMQNYICQFYEDGQAMSMVDAIVTDDITLSLIGKGGSDNNWNGIMDEIKIYNYALSASEVLENYNQYVPSCNDGIENQDETGVDCGGSCSACPDIVSPGLITDLSTSNPTSDSVLLSWTSPGDDAYTGTATQYDIRYSSEPITVSNWVSATPIIAEYNPLLAGSLQTHTVSNLNSGTIYYFAIKTADEIPNWSGLSNIATIETITPNSDPELSTPSLTPTSGDTSTNFKYRITYLDSDNNSPAYVRLYILKNGIEISDSPFDMNDVDALDTNYADGKLYTYSKILASGTYTYYFETQDVVASNIIRTITYTNPTVNTITTPSLISTSPEDSSNNEAYNSDIVLTFSEAMDSITESAITTVPEITWASKTWNSEKTELTLVPKNPLLISTTYITTILTVAQSIKDVNMMTPHTFSFTTAPRFEITVLEPNNQKYNYNTIKAKIKTNYLAEWCELSINNNQNQRMVDISQTEWYINLKVLTEGINNITFECSDTASNRWKTTAQYFEIDTIKPILTFTNPTPINQTINTSYVIINITSNELLSDAIIELDGIKDTMIGTGTNQYAYKGSLENGNHNFRVYGTDRANNTGNLDAWVYVNRTINKKHNIRLDPKDANNRIITDSSISIYDNNDEIIHNFNATNPTTPIDFDSGNTYRIKYNVTNMILDIRNIVILDNYTISPQFVNTYIGLLPAYTKSRSRVIALNDSELIGYHAELTFPTDGSVNRILHCINWNFTSNTCNYWKSNKTTDYNAINTNNKIKFNVTSFDAYMLGFHTEPATCSDKTKNGDETAIDCGGSCSSCTIISYGGGSGGGTTYVPEVPYTDTKSAKIISYPGKIELSANSTLNFQIIIKNTGNLALDNLFIDISNAWFKFERKRISIGVDESEAIPIKVKIPILTMSGEYPITILLKGNAEDIVQFTITVTNDTRTPIITTKNTESANLMFDDLKYKIDEYKLQGYDTTTLKEYLVNAMNAFNVGDIEISMDYINLANKAIEKLEKNKTMVGNTKIFSILFIVIGILMFLIYSKHKDIKRRDKPNDESEMKSESLDVRSQIIQNEMNDNVTMKQEYRYDTTNPISTDNEQEYTKEQSNAIPEWNKQEQRSEPNNTVPVDTIKESKNEVHMQQSESDADVDIARQIESLKKKINE